MEPKPLFRILVWAIIMVALLSSGCSPKEFQEEEATPTPIPTVPALAKPTYNVQRGEVVGLVRFTGRIVPINETEIFFRTNGRVRKIFVKEGEEITAGQVIADLEGIDDLQRQLALRQLDLQRAQIYADIAQLNFNLFVDSTPTWTKGYDIQLAIQQREVDLTIIAVQEASLGLQDLQEVISDTQLIAPVSGLVTSLSLGGGREVQAFHPVGIVADVTQLEVSASAYSDMINRLAVGMEATISPASGLGTEVSGYVRRMPFNLTSEGGGEDYSVRVALNSPVSKAGYVLGDLVKVVVILERQENVLWLPPQAIRTFEGRRFVVVQDGDMQRRVDVKLGILGEERVEILEGLTEGQVVVSP